MDARRIGLVVAGALGALGSVMPWVRVPFVGSLSGTISTGYITLAMCLAAGFSGLGRGPLSPLARAVAGGAGAGSAVLAGAAISAVTRASGDGNDPISKAMSHAISVGEGLWLVAAAAIALVVIALTSPSPDASTSSPSASPDLGSNMLSAHHGSGASQFWAQLPFGALLGAAVVYGLIASRPLLKGDAPEQPANTDLERDLRAKLSSALKLHRYSGVPDTFKIAGGRCDIEEIVSAADQVSRYSGERGFVASPDGTSGVEVGTFTGTPINACSAAVRTALGW